MKQHTIQIDRPIHPLQLHTQLENAFPALYIDFACTWTADGQTGTMVVNLERELVQTEADSMQQVINTHVPQPEPDPVQEAVGVLEQAGLSSETINALLTLLSRTPQPTMD